MTLVRIGWGATAADLGDQPAPRHRPLLRGGRPDVRAHAQPRRVERPPPPARATPASSCASLLLVASVATMVGWHTRLSSVVAVLMMIVLQRANTAIFNSGDLLLRQVGICVALSPCGLLWSLDARRDRRKGRRSQRAPRAVRHALPAADAGARLLPLGVDQVPRGTTWHDGTAIALSLRIEDLQRFVAPEWLFDQARAAQPVHLGHARLRGHLLRARVEPPPAALGARHRRSPPPRHRRSSSTSASSASPSTSPTWPSSPTTWPTARRQLRQASPRRPERRRTRAARTSRSRSAPAGGVGGRGSAGAPHPGGAGSAGPDQQ